MAGNSSKTVIYAALGANLAIAGTKLSASIYTGSSAMLSEAIHSFVDSGNQWLLLHGLRRSAKAPDEKHPFGYGMELYFWSFVVAIMVFAVGAGVSLYEGISKIRDPHAITNAYINYLVLGSAILIEMGPCYLALKAFLKEKGDRSFIPAIRQSKDPTIFTVLFEDSAAMLGLIVAMIGIALAQHFQIPELDGAASVVIGVILAATAAVLAFESKGLLIGEAAHPETQAAVRAMLVADDRISATNEVLTMHLGPKDVLLNLSVDFRDGLSSEEVEAAITELETGIKRDFPEIKRIFIEAQNWLAHRANEARAQDTPPD
jgi:cation diffusion facilitator family transporter